MLYLPLVAHGLRFQEFTKPFVHLAMLTLDSAAYMFRTIRYLRMLTKSCLKTQLQTFEALAQNAQLPWLLLSSQNQPKLH